VEQGYVLASVPLSLIISYISVKDVQWIALAHGIVVRQEVQSNRDGLITCFKDHHCPNCNSSVTVFSIIYKKTHLKLSGRPHVFSASGS